MTITAKKNANGILTGKYRVEVLAGGVRHQVTVDSLEEAERLQTDLKAGKGPQVASKVYAKASPTYTIARLSRDALVVWKGTKDEDQSNTRFLAVCDILKYDTPLERVRTAQLDTVVNVLRSRSLANKTIHRYLAAFSGALRWAVSRDHIAGMPIIPWPECGKGNDTIIQPADELKVLERLKKSGSPDVALVVDVLLATGARIGEVLAVDPDDVNTEVGEVTFRDTKNGDDRTVPLRMPLAVRLKALATVGLPTYRRVNTALHSARKATGVTYVVTPHTLRHTVGTRLSDVGVEVPTIGKLLGHRNVRTTMGYIHPERDAMRRAIERLTATQTKGLEGPRRDSDRDFEGVPKGVQEVDHLQVPLGRVEASPRIELGYKDLQSDTHLSDTLGNQVLPEGHEPEGS